MISSTPLKHPIPPQASRAVPSAGQTQSALSFPLASGVQFGSSTAQPSLWERIKQGTTRLWNALISPFKKILYWFKTPEASPKASETPSPTTMQNQGNDPAVTQPASEATASAKAGPTVPEPSNPPSGSLQPAALSAPPHEPSRTRQSRRPSSGEHQTEAPSTMHSAISQQNRTAPPIPPTVNKPATPAASPQHSEPARPRITDNQAGPTPAPGVGERLKSAFAWLRPQPSATQRHQQALNELQEMIGEPVTPPPTPLKKQAPEVSRAKIAQGKPKPAATQPESVPTKKSQKPTPTAAKTVSKPAPKSSGQGTPTSTRPAGASSRPVASTASLPRVIPVEELFGRDLTRIQFKQRSGNTCYLLSALDAIFHHPQGKQILAKIQIARTPSGYSVKFPGQAQAITVNTDELGSLRLANGTYVDGVQSECLGVRILECAYSKIPNPIFGQYDESKNALTRIFGPDHEVINIQNSRNPSAGVLRNAAGQPIAVDYVNGVRIETILPWGGDHRIGGFEFKHDERIEQFRQYIQNAHTQDELDIVTAKPFNQAHYYAIRTHQSTPETIVLADPFNTKRSIHVKFEDFMEQYDIEGVRLPR